VLLTGHRTTKKAKPFTFVPLPCKPEEPAQLALCCSLAQTPAKEAAGETQCPSEPSVCSHMGRGLRAKPVVCFRNKRIHPGTRTPDRRDRLS
jgi:hypothetical protein